MATPPPVTDPNQLEETYNEIGRQLDALNQQYIGLQSTHSQDRRMDFGGPAAHAAKRQYDAARLAIDAQRQALKNQQSILQQNYGRLARTQHQQDAQQAAAQRVQLAAQKYQETQRKHALAETQKKLAGILGVKPDQVEGKLDDARYDPITHKLIVPTKSKAETKAESDDRKKDLKALEGKVQAYGADNLATGKQVTVNQDNIFGPRPLPFKQDADGNRVYTANGKPYAVIPAGDFDNLKKEYDELNARPVESGKMVSPDTFNAVRAQLGALGGDVPKDIVGEEQALAEQRRLAQPAIDNARGFAPGLLPDQSMVRATDVPVSTAPNSFPPIALPAAVGNRAPALIDPRQNIAVTQDASGRISAAYDPTTDITLPNITSRLPAQVRSVPALQTSAGLLPSITVNQPAATATIPFQTNVLGQDIAMPRLPFEDNRLDAFRPGYVTQAQQARGAYRQLAPGATDDQIDASLKRATAALGANADAERVRNFVAGDLQAEAQRKVPGLGERMTTLGQFLPEPGVAQGGDPFRQTVYSDALRHGYENYVAPVVSALAPPDNLSLLDQNRIRAIQNRVVPPNTTLDEYGKYVDQAQQEAADNFQNF